MFCRLFLTSGLPAVFIMVCQDLWVWGRRPQRRSVLGIMRGAHAQRGLSPPLLAMAPGLGWPRRAGRGSPVRRRVCFSAFASAALRSKPFPARPTLGGGELNPTASRGGRLHQLLGLFSAREIRLCSRLFSNHSYQCRLMDSRL